jgi:hypothetical protein
MTVNILCYDNRATFKSGSNQTADQNALHTCPFHGRKLLVNGGWTLPQIANGILLAAAGEKIDTLHFFAHGHAGYLELGYPEVDRLTKETALWFGILKGHFGGRKMIELHACNVASCTIIPKDFNTHTPAGKHAEGRGKWANSGPGYDLMHELAQQTGANVKAPLNFQYFYRSLVMNGPAAIVTPTGEVTWVGKAGWAGELLNKIGEVIDPSR